MKPSPEALAGPLIALLLLVLIFQQTLGALRAAGAWGRRTATVTRHEDPYAPLDRALASADSVALVARDPFHFARTPAPRLAARRPEPQPVTPVAPPPPQLTAIIFDNDPRATIRYQGRDYPVRVNSLFADFRVVRIARDEVVLDRAGEMLVLKLPTKGE